MAFEFGTTSPSLLTKKRSLGSIPIDPIALTALTGGFWNAVGAPKSPIIASQKPNLLPQVQVGNQGQDFAPGQAADEGGIAALLKAFTAPHGHHFGIGGAEISETNPYGNPGGDPFKNGFFKPSPAVGPMNYLSGTPNPDATQLAMLQAAKRQRTTTPPIGMPAGDPQARAFWSSMGMGQPKATVNPIGLFGTNGQTGAIGPNGDPEYRAPRSPSGQVLNSLGEIPPGPPSYGAMPFNPKLMDDFLNYFLPENQRVARRPLM